MHINGTYYYLHCMSKEYCTAIYCIIIIALFNEYAATVLFEVSLAHDNNYDAFNPT